VIGFAAQTDNLEHFAKEKLHAKGLDAVVANRVGSGLGFACAQNQGCIYFPDGQEHVIPLMDKYAFASEVLNACCIQRLVQS
jgi:phosphopantothenoylcysteine decarboxylase / phosphopantothenate---cysteine ligase